MALSNIFTKKQVEVLQQTFHNHKWKLMINTGAVRAGKTFVDNFIFLYELKHAAMIAKEDDVSLPHYILAGASSKTIQSNILDELENTFGLQFAFNQHNSFDVKFSADLPAVRVVQAYTGSIGGMAGIRGMTSYGAYINEASLARKEVFDEIQKRCSGRGSRIVCDTNPDIPTHFLKQIIDRAKEKHDETVISNHFTIFDNEENLDPAYLQHILSTTPSGMMYDRDILGKWTSGEGIVYSDYDRKYNLISKAQFKNDTRHEHLHYYCGVDFGYEHKGVIVVMADDNHGNTYLVEEHTHKHLQGIQWVNIAKKIQKKYNNPTFYCETARPEYTDMFRDHRIKAIGAYKRILAGVDIVGGLIKSHSLKVVKEGINYFEKELFQYVWDEKTGEPLKADGNDDVMDAVRYAIATEHKRNEKLRNNKPQTLNQKARVLANNGLI